MVPRVAGMYECVNAMQKKKNIEIKLYLNFPIRKKNKKNKKTETVWSQTYKQLWKFPQQLH